MKSVFLYYCWWKKSQQVSVEAHWSKSPHPKMVLLLSVLCRLYPWISMASRIKEQLRWLGNVLVGSYGSSPCSQQKTSQQADSVNSQSLRGRWGESTHISSSSGHLCLPAWTEFCQTWLLRFGGKQQRRCREMQKPSSADSFSHASETAWQWWNEAWRRFRQVGASWSKQR